MLIFSLSNYLKKKKYLLFYFTKWNFCFYVWTWELFSDWWKGYIQTFLMFELYSVQLKLSLYSQRLNNLCRRVRYTTIVERFKKYTFCINNISFFSNKFLYYFLNLFFFACAWSSYKYIIRVKKRTIKRLLRRRFKRVRYKKRRSKRLKKEVSKRGRLYITFSKRNMYINLAGYDSSPKVVTTLRRSGFLGRRRKEYTSIFIAVRMIKQRLRWYKMKAMAIIYSGWNRFRVAVKNALRYRDRYRIPVFYIKFTIRIPHNGCRQKKKKRKKRKKKIWLKKKIYKK